MKSLFHILCSVHFLFFILASNALAQNYDFDGSQHVDVTLLSDVQTFQPSDSLEKPIGRIGVKLTPKKGWHLYWKNSGEAGLPSRVNFETSPSVKVGALRWPAPMKFKERGNIITYGYMDSFVLVADVFETEKVDERAEKVSIKAHVSWLVCKDICVPGQKTVSLHSELSSSKPLEPTSYAKEFDFTELTSERSFEKAKNLLLKKPEITLLKNQVELRFAPAFSIPPDGIENHLQVFPLSNPLHVLSNPRVFISERDSMVTVVIDTAIMGDPSQEELPIEGVLVFSELLAKTSHPVSVAWEQTSTKPQSTSNVGSSEAKPLTYRFVTEKEKKIGEKVVLKKSSENIFIALFSAFIAGIILNLMPCVLPILSIKVMSLVEQTQKSRAEVVRSALSYAAGILSSFAVLAVIVSTLRASGDQLGWGFQFQYPEFVFALVLVTFLLSLGFFDIYYISIPFVGKLSKKSENTRSVFFKNFFDGVLATALSTPCTAPFLGTALIAAFSQSAWVTALVFLSIGAGLGFPYIWIALDPRLIRFVPKPGWWMVQLKEFLGFLLLGTVIWLVSIQNTLRPDATVWTIGFLLLIFLTLWAYRWSKDGKGTFLRIIQALILCITFYTGIVVVWPKIASSVSAQSEDSSTLAWKDYSEDLNESLLKDGKTVFIDFTAEWCITCKANEYLVINTKATKELFELHEIVALKADWTSGASHITEALKKYGGNGVPHYVLLNKKTPGVKVLPPLLSDAALKEAVKEVSNSR